MAAAENRGDLYSWARRFKKLNPEETIPIYIDSIAFAIANATPRTAYASSVNAIADAIVTATYSCHPAAREGVIKQILVSVKYKDMADIMVALQRKKIEVMNDTCDRMALLPYEVQKRVDSLVQLQKQHDDNEKQMLLELNELAATQANQNDMTEEAKMSAIEAVKTMFEHMFESMYEERCAIVSCASVEDEGASVEDEGAGEGIPTFWFLAMMAVKQLREKITEDDELVLKYLTDVKFGKTNDARGLKFEFFFDPNPFFTNDVLRKVYRCVSIKANGKFDYDNVKFDIEKASGIGTVIGWTQCLTETPVQTRQKRCINCHGYLPKTSGRKSFFNFFDDIELVSVGDEDKAQDRLIRDALREMFAHAVTYFLDSEVVREEIEVMEKELEEMVI